MQRNREHPHIGHTPLAVLYDIFNILHIET